MKLLSALVFLSVSVMVWLTFEAIKQEMRIRQLRSSFALSSGQMRQKEDRIHQIKLKMVELNEQLTPLKTKMDELHIKKKDSLAATEQLDKDLQACNQEKESLEGRKTSMTAELQKIKADNEMNMKTKLEEISNLKQHLLERDMAVCAFVDKSNKEGRNLCDTAA